MPNLKLREEGRETVHDVGQGPVTIGRGPSNALVIADALASKEHCRVERIGERWRLIDLESKNGTRLNGQFRNCGWLSHEDTIRIGKAELRFGVEGARRAAVPAGEAGEGRPSRVRQRGPAPTAGDKALKLSLISVGIILGVVVFLNTAKNRTPEAQRNRELCDNARVLLNGGDYDGAERYLTEHGDPDTAGYDMVQRLLAEIQTNRGAARKVVADRESNRILYELGRDIDGYHWGYPSKTAEGILALVQRLKTEYADTEASRQARKLYPAWFEGRVPERGSETSGGGSPEQRRFETEWRDALRRSREFEQEWRFREARETLERFLSAREAVMTDDATVDTYRRLLKEELSRLDLAAGGRFAMEERRAWEMQKLNKHDDAIAVFRKIIERFGIDQYARRAQEEIGKIEASRKK
ncbi:MAG: FHA domain-containing protein [Planctomycetaceae bacterium]